MSVAFSICTQATRKDVESDVGYIQTPSTLSPLFAIRCSLFVVRCSLFAVRYARADKMHFCLASYIDVLALAA
jgi:hypothetical protein